MSAPAFVLIRFSEIALKGDNRQLFIKKLATNLRHVCRSLGCGRVQVGRMRLVVELDEPNTAVFEQLLSRLSDIPGVRSLSAAHRIDPTLEAITQTCLELVAERMAATSPPETFRVSARRSDKRFPLQSVELNRAVGGAILEAHPSLKVSLKHFDMDVGIEVQHKRAFVYGDRHEGPGGLPVGTSGKCVHLLSGGLDSPVAGYMLQNRGLQLAPLYFHSPPFIGEAARSKVIDLARILGMRQPKLRLRIAPFTNIQTALKENCESKYLVVLYRRMMLRVAQAVARKHRIFALSTGDSVGQVASQTLRNIATISAVCDMPILRPLCGMGKEQTIDLARRLGMFEIATLPALDCCSLFVPNSPVTHCRTGDLAGQEANVDTDALVAECVAGLETVDL